MERCSTKYAKSFVVIGIALFILDYIGIAKHYLELDYKLNFNYPSGFPSEYSYDFTDNPSEKCGVAPKLLIIIKSAIANIDRRNLIRQTWGTEHRFSDVEIRRIFLLGVSSNIEMDHAVESESETRKDIVRIDFIDDYFNNTLKTMMGMQWAVTYCGNSDYFLFVDDDYYVSIKNLLKFLANPDYYPKSATNFVATKDQKNNLFAGFVMQTPPHRHKFSKWYIPLSEYPYDLWPPYVTAGAFVLNRNGLSKLYNSGERLKRFRFDDIFLGIAALKANLSLTHCNYFFFNKPAYKGPSSYQFTIASHGFHNGQELAAVWNECRSAGFA